MNNKKELPQRKHPRLNTFDYSSTGAYFITICTQNRRCVLSSAETIEIEYSVYGKIAKEQLLLLENRYPCLSIDKFVIMPNHIHVILFLQDDAAGVNPRPTIMDMICAYKSLTTRECKKAGFAEKLFQTSFYEHIIRGKEDYEEIVKYICENPIHWLFDELYTEG